MSAAPEDLDAIEAELADADRVVCPVCRFEQSLDNDLCARCKTDLTLLSHTLREARDRRLALYRAIFANDPVTALTHLHDVSQLTGATPELAVLRKLLRHGAMPVELLTPDEPNDADERLAAYQPDEDLGLTPAVPEAEQAEADAYAALLPAEAGSDDLGPPPAERGEAGGGPATEVPGAEGSEPPLAERGEAGGGPADVAPADEPPPPRVSPPVPLLQNWALAIVAILLALVLGVGIGRMTAPATPAPAPPAPSTGVIQWHMAPLPEPPAAPQPSAPAPPAKPGP
ncbi:MAG: hypothetical protein HYU66_16835 [Armatimonadetes bacterium]|nr:hypothetical protein [Armatimonadota bacterium]